MPQSRSAWGDENMGRLKRPNLVAKLKHCESGATAVEFAIVAWLFISFVLGIIEFGRALHERNQLSRAVDAAARTVLVAQAGDALTRARDAGKAALTTADKNEFTLSLVNAAVGPVQYKKIEVRYNFRPILAGIIAPVEMKVDRFVCPVSECP